jgi:hypothetical protein
MVPRGGVEQARQIIGLRNGATNDASTEFLGFPWVHGRTFRRVMRRQEAVLPAIERLQLGSSLSSPHRPVACPALAALNRGSLR